MTEKDKQKDQISIDNQENETKFRIDTSQPTVRAFWLGYYDGFYYVIVQIQDK